MKRSIKITEDFIIGVEMKQNGFTIRRYLTPELTLLNNSIHPSMYLLAKCQNNANNHATDNAKWSTEQKRETLC